MTATRDLRRVSYPYGLGTGARRVYAYLETQRMMGQTEVSAWTLQQAMTRHSMSPSQVAMSCNQLEDGKIIAKAGDDRDIDGIPLTVRLVALYSPPASEAVVFDASKTLTKAQQRTLSVVRCVSDGITLAADIAPLIGLKINATNHYLLRGYEVGYLTRWRGDNKFEYGVTDLGRELLAGL